MHTYTCDHCQRRISGRGIYIGHAQPNVPAESGDVRPAHLCDVGCLRGWLEVNHPVRRPDFDAARAILFDALLDEAAS